MLMGTGTTVHVYTQVGTRVHSVLCHTRVTRVRTLGPYNHCRNGMPVGMANPRVLWPKKRENAKMPGKCEN